MLQDKSFIDFDHMGKFLQYSMSREEFFQKLSSAKFSVCPRGNAYDTFRMWDSLYLGTIPIVVKEARYQESLTDLPILFLDSYEQFATLSLDFLNEKYEQMLQQVFDYKKLTIDHWLPQSCRV
jgi:hypothetical protein